MSFLSVPPFFYFINWIMINASFNVMENLTEASIYYDTVLHGKIRECHIFIRQLSNCLSLTM